MFLHKNYSSQLPKRSNLYAEAFLLHMCCFLCKCYLFGHYVMSHPALACVQISLSKTQVSFTIIKITHHVRTVF